MNGAPSGALVTQSRSVTCTAQAPSSPSRDPDAIAVLPPAAVSSTPVRADHGRDATAGQCFRSCPVHCLPPAGRWPRRRTRAPAPAGRHPRLGASPDHGQNLEKSWNLPETPSGRRCGTCGNVEALDHLRCRRPIRARPSASATSSSMSRRTRLRRQGRPVKLGRQPMDLLILLVESRGQLVSRSDIVERLWGKDVFVDVETGVNTAISKVRQALRDSPDAPAFVETVPGKGYRFIAAVEVVPQCATRRLACRAPGAGARAGARSDDGVTSHRHDHVGRRIGRVLRLA